MTPEEKAQEIIDKYLPLSYFGAHRDQAQKCATLCVEQIIEALEMFGYTSTFYDSFVTGKMTTTEADNPTCYWSEVLEHIKKQ